ncbi:MAG: GreA/GreB family elongation factor [Patescibacteria group bacterium]|nr:GreA/GreB family elongation factor [Patescibacteria group bacterium]
MEKMRVYFTKDGLESLEREIDEANTRALTAAIQVAESVQDERGDEYGNAGFMDGERVINMWAKKAKELIRLRNSATIVDPEPNDGTVKIGRLVAVREMFSGRGRAFRVGSFLVFEKRKMGKIPTFSYTAPLVAPLLGTEVGDEVEFCHANKNHHYKVIKIE